MGSIIDNTKPRIAIVGGGVVSIILTLGLIERNIPVRVYEQASGFREVGAGFAFSACARHCMNLLSPAITEALKRCGAVPISDESEKDNYLRWVDGYNQHRPDDPSYQRPLAQIGGGGFRGCRRDQFLQELAKDVPPGVIEFSKRMDSLEHKEDGSILLTFADGTTVETDAVIGCDGIKSNVRKSILGADNKASYAQYTHKIAYRGLVPMTDAIEVLGPWKANNFHHHIGPGAHITHYPVANHQALNVVIFLSDPGPWAGDSSMVSEGTRHEVEAALQDWHPTVQNLVKLMPSKLNKWGLFDLGDHPMPAYHDRNICLAGDAAHATTPHHGAGACLGAEDALCLATLLEQVNKRSTDLFGESKNAVEVAFDTFDRMRRRRTQWLVNSSRRVCDLYHQQEWADPERWTKADTCFEEIRDRSYKIWYFDAEDMIQETLVLYEEQLRVQPKAAQGSADKDGYIL
ncbi:salicylate 1-monooxygenase [Fusarium denticulatum]|uniref:Salicylate 1-monooxygenase n=1 Tax=Fusarium denticulatum TaxID=48507 RepID=A0A8H5U0R5_9HYPO|nr:salicylate 1-monooxygenase [Fusarium denticulatum]